MESKTERVELESLNDVIKQEKRETEEKEKQGHYARLEQKWRREQAQKRPEERDREVRDAAWWEREARQIEADKRMLKGEVVDLDPDLDGLGEELEMEQERRERGLGDKVMNGIADTFLEPGSRFEGLAVCVIWFVIILAFSMTVFYFIPQGIKVAFKAIF